MRRTITHGSSKVAEALGETNDPLAPAVQRKLAIMDVYIFILIG